MEAALLPLCTDKAWGGLHSCHSDVNTFLAKAALGLKLLAISRLDRSEQGGPGSTQCLCSGRVIAAVSGPGRLLGIRFLTVLALVQDLPAFYLVEEYTGMLMTGEELDCHVSHSQDGIGGAS